MLVLENSIGSPASRTYGGDLIAGAMEAAERSRTADVLAGGGMRSFAELLLPGQLLQALKAAGYQRPSPVQVPRCARWLSHGLRCAQRSSTYF